MLWRVALVAAALALCCPGAAPAEEVTGAADNLRTGWYPDEPSLAPASVTESAFAQAFKTQLKGSIFAQPLIANGALLVVTEDDMAYALDPVTGLVRWERKFGTPVNSSELKEGTLTCPDISPHVGITSTPVIDTASNVAYFVANSYLKGESGESGWYMHAVNLSSGNEVSGFPVQITGEANNNKNVKLVGNKQLQRPALLMLEGVVYAAFGSHCDFPPYSGLVAGVSTSGHMTALWAVSEKGGSIWQSGGGLISDGPRQILFATANPDNTNGEGDPGKAPGGSPPEGFLAESVVRLEVQPEGHLKPTSFFSPWNNKELDKEDFDIGSAAPIALPSKYFGTPAYPNLLVQASKKGEVYLLNRGELGGMGQGFEGKDKVIEEKGLGEYGGVWDGLALWPGDGGFLYIPGVSKPGTGQENFNYLRYFKYGVKGEVPNLSSAATSAEQFGFGSGAPIITSNGTSNGSAVLWITHCPYVEPNHCEGAELEAYNALPVAGGTQRLWKAPIGWASKFSRPEASAGHIYVGNKEGMLFSFSGHMLSPSTPSLELGAAAPGAQRSAEVTFTNLGTPLKVSAVHPPSTPFGATGLPAVGSRIEPGQAIAVRVSFSPAVPGRFTGSVGITTEAGETSIGLSGSAAEPAAAAPPPSAILSGSQTPATLVSSPPAGGSLGFTALALGNLKLHLLSSRPGQARRAKVSYTLTAAGRVALVLYRRVVSHRCHGGVRTCAIYVRTKLSHKVAGHAGANVLTLDLGRLSSGEYRLTATPSTSPPTRTVTRSVAFIVR